MSIPFFIISAALFLQSDCLQKYEQQNFTQQKNVIGVARKKEEQEKWQQNLEFYQYLNSKTGDYNRTIMQNKNRTDQPYKRYKRLQ